MREQSIKYVSVIMRNLYNDLITDINGVIINNLTAANLVLQNPAHYWIEKNTDGDERLCSAIVDQTILTITALNGNNSYSVIADNYNQYSLIGGHPIHRPK